MAYNRTAKEDVYHAMLCAAGYTADLMATVMGMSPRALRNRARDPRLWTIGELERMADKLRDPAAVTHYLSTVLQ